MIIEENIYSGELVRYPGPWAFQLAKSHIILVSDMELEALTDPDRKINMTLGYEPRLESLRQVCERAKAAGHRTLILAFDHFFSQYRPGQAGPRHLTPDMDDYVRLIGSIGRFAQQFGLGLELSLLSPLEIGPAYRQATGESGVWMHYRKGLRDPASGAFSVQLWRHRQWANNKGPVALEDAGLRAFAFRESPIPQTPYSVVDPAAIQEISEVAEVEVVEADICAGPMNGQAAGSLALQRIRIHGRGRTEVGPLDRVLVVQQYRCPEMDYFSDQALPFLCRLVDKYAAAGVQLNGLYADEMHIQQDWSYFQHHDHGQFAMRYVTPSLARKFAEAFGEQYRDFAKYLVYFCYGQEDYASDLRATEGRMHVFGPAPQAIRETALFRSRYFRFLHNGVVDLFTAAKRYTEKRMGRKLESRAHPTWAESPTCDYWRKDRPGWPAAGEYDYTSSFVWSNTVHQAAAACDDWFKWGDFLTGNGNDHAECGWLDRNYFGLALACSTGILNEVPYSYAAHWGMPEPISRRRQALVNVFGAAAAPPFSMVQDLQHRDVEVLMLHPLDLVAVEERFGSWMTQYGYANLVTTAKLLERGQVAHGAIEMAGRRFTTLVATFEPFPPARLLEMMHELVHSGGRVIWSGPPPVLTGEGQPALETWREIFSAQCVADQTLGRMAPGREVRFEGLLAGVPPQVILTDYLVDHIYPAVPDARATVVARVAKTVVGTHRAAPGGGSATFLGFRPRDDQSRSLGYEMRTWFEILHALGAYAPTGQFAGINDNTEYLSRTTPYLFCRFPNGAVAAVPHLREVVEDWEGGFARHAERDQEYLRRCPPPGEALRLEGLKVNGHDVTYEGTGAMSFRVDGQGRLAAFAGGACNRIVVDGTEFVLADRPMEELAFAPVSADRRTHPGVLVQILVRGAGTVRLPAAGFPEGLHLFAEGPTPGSCGDEIPSRRQADSQVFTVPEHAQGRWIYGVLCQNSAVSEPPAEGTLTEPHRRGRRVR